MAMLLSTKDLKDVIGFFLKKNTIEVLDQELLEDFRQNGKNLTAEELVRILQSLGSSLFALEKEAKDQYRIRLEPKVNVDRSID